MAMPTFREGTGTSDVLQQLQSDLLYKGGIESADIIAVLQSVTSSQSRLIGSAFMGSFHHYELSYGRFPEMVRQSAMTMLLSGVFDRHRDMGEKWMHMHAYLYGLHSKTSSRIGILERCCRNLSSTHQRQRFSVWMSIVADLLARRLIHKYISDGMVSVSGFIRDEFEKILADLGVTNVAFNPNFWDNHSPEGAAPEEDSDL